MQVTESHGPAKRSLRPLVHQAKVTPSPRRSPLAEPKGVPSPPGSPLIKSKVVPAYASVHERPSVVQIRYSPGKSCMHTGTQGPVLKAAEMSGHAQEWPTLRTPSSAAPVFSVRPIPPSTAPTPTSPHRTDATSDPPKPVPQSTDCSTVLAVPSELLLPRPTARPPPWATPVRSSKMALSAAPSAALAQMINGHGSATPAWGDQDGDRTMQASGG